jgi:2'-5' RNA ligase
LAGAVSGTLIVLAELGNSDFAWLDELRRRHYPAERNRVPAHLTLFRALPPSAEDEVRRRLSRAAAAPAPRAEMNGVLDMDSGVALRVQSQELDELRERLAEEFRGLLPSQDHGPGTPHVTIQNKAEPGAARQLLHQMRASFEPRPLEIRGLELVRYLEGSWGRVARYSFRGPSSSPRSHRS